MHKVQSTLSIRECNPSFDRVYVTSRAPPFEVCPEAGGKTIVRAKFRAFYRSRILPRDSLETRSRARLERKGKERKKKRKKLGGSWIGRGGRKGETRLVYQRFGFLPTFFPIAPDSIFLGRNDLRHGPLLLPVREKAWKTRLEWEER